MLPKLGGGGGREPKLAAGGGGGRKSGGASELSSMDESGGGGGRLSIADGGGGKLVGSCRWGGKGFEELLANKGDGGGGKAGSGGGGGRISVIGGGGGKFPKSLESGLGGGFVACPLAWLGVLALIVGEGVDGLELDGVLRFVHAELTAAFFSAVLKLSYSDTPYFAMRIPVIQSFMDQASSQHMYLIY